MMNPDMVDPNAYIADLERRLHEAELHGAALASQLTEKVEEVDTLRAGFPSEAKETIVEVFYLKGDEPFVCGLHGNPVILEEVEAELVEDLERFDKGEGTYLYRADYWEAQTGEYGRVEIPAFWDLTLVRFKAVVTSAL